MNEDEDNALANYIQGFTSGFSVITLFPNNDSLLPKEVFIEVYGWVLYNNGLIMECPIALN